MTTMSTKRLTLRLLRKATPRQLVWLRDKDVVKYSEQRHTEHSLSSQLRYVTAFPGHLWGIYLAESGQHIGNLGAAIDGPNNVADVGIMIGEKDLWGKGIASEAWSAACNWLLDRDGGRIRKLEAGCMRSNIAMKRIIEKSGFQYEGERISHFILEGVPTGALLYGRSR